MESYKAKDERMILTSKSMTAVPTLEMTCNTQVFFFFFFFALVSFPQAEIGGGEESRIIRSRWITTAGCFDLVKFLALKQTSQKHISLPAQEWEHTKQEACWGL